MTHFTTYMIPGVHMGYFDIKLRYFELKQITRLFLQML